MCGAFIAPSASPPLPLPCCNRPALPCECWQSPIQECHISQRMQPFITQFLPTLCRFVLLMDPILGTGNSAARAIQVGDGLEASCGAVLGGCSRLRAPRRLGGAALPLSALHCEACLLHIVCIVAYTGAARQGRVGGPHPAAHPSSLSFPLPQDFPCPVSVRPYRCR